MMTGGDLVAGDVEQLGDGIVDTDETLEVSP